MQLKERESLEILSVSQTGNCQTELLFILFMGRWTRSQKVKKKGGQQNSTYIPEVCSFSSQNLLFSFFFFFFWQNRTGSLRRGNGSWKSQKTREDCSRQCLSIITTKRKKERKKEEAYNWKELYERNSILFHSEATYISAYTTPSRIYTAHTHTEREGEHY